MPPCLMPWTSLKLYSDHASCCCMAEYDSLTFPPIGNRSDGGPWAHWNSPQFRLMRSTMHEMGIQAACRSEHSDPSCPFRCFSMAASPSYLGTEPHSEDQRINVDSMLKAAAIGQEIITSYPLEMEVRLDTRCNLNCPICSQRPFRGSEFELRIEDFEGELRDFLHYGIRLTLTGGEPTVSPRYHAMMDLVREADGCRVFLITNGLRLMDRVLPYVDVVDVVAVSIDAADAETYRSVRGGDFDHLLDQVRQFRADPVGMQRAMTASFVITGVNAWQMPAMVELVASLGITHMSLNEVHSVDHWMTPTEARPWVGFREDPQALAMMEDGFSQAMYAASGHRLDISYSLPSIGRLGRSTPVY